MFTDLPFKQLSTRRRIAFWVLCTLIVMRIVSGQIFIDSSIERIEIESGHCLSIDLQCSASATKHQVDLGDNPSHPLNLSLHLLGNLAVPTDTLAPYLPTQSELHATLKNLPLWAFPAAIFHPPQR